MFKYFNIKSWDWVDIGLHMVAAIGAYAIGYGLLHFFGGAVALTSVILGFLFAREIEQHDWSVFKMGRQSWAEIIIPAVFLSVAVYLVT